MFIKTNVIMTTFLGVQIDFNRGVSTRVENLTSMNLQDGHVAGSVGGKITFLEKQHNTGFDLSLFGSSNWPNICVTVQFRNLFPLFSLLLDFIRHFFFSPQQRLSHLLKLVLPVKYLAPTQTCTLHPNCTSLNYLPIFTVYVKNK